VDVAVNDVLDWAVMDAAKERGRSTYDLVGAENERINSYKAKFNPTLQEYYSLERASPAVSIAAHLYKQVRSSARLSLK
jgi:lipid II:glycine glycyltransferase (peptidoglycan interpeptide bridge formation enzyme)